MRKKYIKPSCTVIHTLDIEEVKRVDDGEEAVDWEMN